MLLVKWNNAVATGALGARSTASSLAATGAHRARTTEGRCTY